MTLMAEFNVQMTPLFDMLRAIDTYVEQQGSWPTTEDEESMDVESAPTMEKKEMFHIANPLPSWFVEPNINANAEEEGHFTTIRTEIATGPLSNSKANDIEQMLFVYERKKDAEPGRSSSSFHCPSTFTFNR